jgi:hypothetical protein
VNASGRPAALWTAERNALWNTARLDSSGMPVAVEPRWKARLAPHRCRDGPCAGRRLSPG